MDSMRSAGDLNRRNFLKSVAAVGGAWLAAGCMGGTQAGEVPAAPSASVVNPDNIGVQLYTVRDLLEKDFTGTIEKVAQIGYREVEFAGYYDHTPQQVRELLDRVGLKSPSGHIGLELLRDGLDAQIQSAQTIGQTYVTIPALPDAFTGKITAEQWHAYAKEFNQIGTALKDNGLHLAYHNHFFEFVPADGGKMAYDVLLSETDPELVSFEMDLMWTVFAGQDPLTWFQKYPGRFVMWHVKDMKGVAEAQAAMKQSGMQGFREVLGHIAAVGEGEIDFKDIFAHAEQAGLQHFFVENDAPQDALANIQTSYNNLKQIVA
ncbi:MAG TPA: TIM barrel protein [Rhodothermales bacterium]|nr:TIM barrel protein [Rhodothermales bacterium]